MRHLDPSWFVALASALTCAAAIALFRPQDASDPLDHEVSRASRSPERVAEAWGDALRRGQLRLASALSSGSLRASLERGVLPLPIPDSTLQIIEERRDAPEKRTLLASATFRTDAGFTEGHVELIVRRGQARWTVTGARRLETLADDDADD